MSRQQIVPKFTPEQTRMHLTDSSRALADLTANMVYDEPELLIHWLMWLYQEKGFLLSVLPGSCASAAPGFPNCSDPIVPELSAN